MNVRTYLKHGFNDTYVSDTNDNYVISLSDNQPNKRGIQYKNINFKVKQRKQLKQMMI